jgi:hypothetical protein
MPPRKNPMPPPTSGLRRTSSMQQKAASAQPGARKAAPKRRRRSTVDLRAALLARSGGVCEMNLGLWCLVRGVDPCHRVGTGMGGRHGDAAALSDRPSNAVWGCRACHDWTHLHPAMAKAFGLILSNGANPEREPVLLRYGVVFLADDGSWQAAPPADAKAIRDAQRRRESAA